MPLHYAIINSQSMALQSCVHFPRMWDVCEAIMKVLSPNIFTCELKLWALVDYICFTICNINLLRHSRRVDF